MCDTSNGTPKHQKCDCGSVVNAVTEGSYSEEMGSWVVSCPECEASWDHQDRKGANERFEAVCEGCGLNTIVEWDGERGLCDRCRRRGVE